MGSLQIEHSTSTSTRDTGGVVCSTPQALYAWAKTRSLSSTASSSVGRESRSDDGSIKFTTSVGRESRTDEGRALLSRGGAGPADEDDGWPVSSSRSLPGSPAMADARGLTSADAGGGSLWSHTRNALPASVCEDSSQWLIQIV